jgi:hypothetical protein
MAIVISHKYEVLDLLGQGGMGVVYKVHHTALDTILALKALPRELMDNQEMVRRFYREARVMAQLRHPNIVRVLDIDRDDSLPCYYFVMEYLQGQTLRQYLHERGPLPLLEVLEISRQVARALSYAHNRSLPVIHRDIKPSNIMIEDGSGRVVVMDFGIAKELDKGESTESGVVLGTPKYCAPEQLRREPLDGSADVYALGMVMYEAYAGKQFFADLKEPEVIVRMLSETEEHEPQFVRPTPPAFAALVTKAMAKSRARRYRCVDDFLRDLESCWAALENTGTAIIPMPSRKGEFQTQHKPDDLSEIEAEIQRLKEERQKRLALGVQTQARESREQAVQKGAGRWATALFQQGLGREESGHAYLRDQNYDQAQKAYQEAVSLFTQAGEEAKAAALLHQAEQVRQEMVAAKAEAERYGAREKARTFYGRGLTLQARADELWKNKAYEQARQLYAEACSVFEDARELAYRLGIKAGTETAREEMKRTRDLAVQEGAETLAPAALQEAVLTQRQADIALAHEEFTQAREFYIAARQQYEAAHQQTRTARAAQEAERERARQRTSVSRHRMEEARTAAEREGAAARLPTEFAQAQQLAEQGWEQEVHEKCEEAIRVYEQAFERFIQIQQKAEHQVLIEQERQRQMALEAKQQAEHTQRVAEEEEAFQYAEELCRRASEAKSEAEQGEALGKWKEAAEAFTRAATLFAQAISQGADRARQEVFALRAEAERQGAKEKATALYEKGLALEARATAQWEQAAYQQARQLYAEARTVFANARELAQRETLKEQAQGARTQVATAREAAQRAGAEELASLAFQEAVEKEQQADAAMRQEDFGLASELYDSIRQKYDAVRHQASIERQYRQALAAQQQVEEARLAAEAAGAKPQHAAYQQAVDAQRRGDTRLVAQEYEQAVLEYGQARDGYERAARECGQEQWQRAETARQQMAETKEKGSALGRQAASRWAEAQTWETRAEQAYRAQHYDEATAGYEQARHIYKQAEAEVAYEQLRQEALHAQRAAAAARDQVTTLTHVALEKWAEVQVLEAEADDAWHAQDYEQARVCYEQVCHSYEQIRQEDEEEQRCRPALEARQQTEQHQKTAEEVEAQRYAQDLFQRALEAKQEGEQKLTAEQWEEAVERFSQAQQLFVQARYDARLQQAKLGAEAARAQALVVQAEAAGENGAELFPGRYEDAAARLREADLALARTEFGVARMKFEQSTILFAQIHRDAVRYRQREQAEQARVRALGLQEQTSALHGRQKRRAEKSFLEGGQLFQQQHYTEAHASYEEAASLLAALLPQSQAASATTTRTSSLSRLMLLAGFTLLSVILGLSLVLHQTPKEEPERALRPSSSPPKEAPGKKEGEATQAQALITKEETDKKEAQETGKQALVQQEEADRQDTEAAQKRALVAKKVAESEEAEKLVAFQEPVDTQRQADMPVESGESEQARERDLDVQQQYAPAQQQAKESQSSLIPPEPAKKLPPGRRDTGWEVRQIQDAQNEVFFVAFSPDGKTVLSGSRDKTLKLWDVETGRKLRTFVGHGDWVNGVAFSPDGKTGLSGSDDRALKLWDVVTGKELRSFPGHTGVVTGVAFSPDGETVLSGSSDKTVKLWDVKTGQQLHTFAGHSGWIWAVAFSPDGKTVLSGSEDKTLRLWDVKTGQGVQTFSGHSKGVTAVAFSPDGKTVLSGSHDRTVRLWEVATGKQLHSFFGHGAIVNSVAFSPDGKLAVSGSRDKTLKLWDVATGREVRTFSGHNATVIGTAFSPDGKLVVSGSRDKTLRLWWAAFEPKT